MAEMAVQNGATEALVFDVKRYAINDGPGIRVYAKPHGPSET